MHAPEAPLLPLRQLNNSQGRRNRLPRGDRSLAAFLVKVSDVLVGGIFTLNVLSATYFLNWGNPDATKVMSFCIVSSQGWKAFVFGLPLAFYPITVWISGVARSAEIDRRGLSTVSVWVFLAIMWCLLLGALLTHCWSQAEFIQVVLVAAGIIALLFAMWGFSFNRPACFRCCCCNCCYSSWCCCCLPPEIAAAEDSDQAIAAEELARQVARAQAALAAQVRVQEEAAAATEREIEADNAHKKAIEEAETSCQLAEEAVNDLQAATDELTAKIKAKKDAAMIKCEKQDMATVARTRATNAATARLKEATDAAIAAEKELEEATQVVSALTEDIYDAYERVLEASSANELAEDGLPIDEVAINVLQSAEGELLAKSDEKNVAVGVVREKQELAATARTRVTDAVNAPLVENAAAIAAERELEEATQVDSAATADICAAARRARDASSANKAAEVALSIANRKARDAHQNSAAAKMVATMAREKETKVCTAAKAVFDQLQVVRAVAQV